jgi:hypothetical protein
MRVRRVVAFVGLVGLAMLVGGCGSAGSAEAGPVPKETASAKIGGHETQAKDAPAAYSQQ